MIPVLGFETWLRVSGRTQEWYSSRTPVLFHRKLLCKGMDMFKKGGGDNL